MLLYVAKAINTFYLSTLFLLVFWHIADANVNKSKSTRRIFMLSWVTNFFRYLGKQVNEDYLTESK